VKALILAGGPSTRMGDLTKETPKCLLKVGDKSIIEYQINWLNKVGINKICTVLGPNSEKVINLLGNKSEYIINNKFKDTGTLYGTYIAKDDVYNDDLLIVYGDLLFDYNLLKEIMNKEGDIVITYFPGVYEKEQMYVNIKDGFLNKISLNINKKDMSGYWTLMTKLSKKGIKLIFDEMESSLKENANNSKAHFAEVIFQRLISKGIPIHAYPSKATVWYNINRREELEFAREHILPKLKL